MSFPERLAARVRDVPDFPTPGIVFKDLTPVLADGPLFSELVQALCALPTVREATQVVGVEARGFIFGAAVAHRLGLGFVPVRKPGKLPAKTLREAYSLEYGADVLEIHADALSSADRVLLVDDLLATGGTAAAAVTLVRRLGAGVVGALFVVELRALEGRSRLGPDVPIHSLLRL